ncbi:MAG TPA: CPBP family intramembrane metalloprotease [Firmicutes bacterium]|nr:CPBP family intramembrane metalloprotease [Bacillota bacterium]
MDQQSLKTEETLPKRESSTGKPCFSSYQINKQMEKNGTMLFIYQLIMQGFAFLVVFYMMLGFTFLEKTFDLENLEYIQSEFVALTYLLTMLAVLIAYIPVYFYMKKQGLLLSVQMQKTDVSKKIVGIGLVLCFAASSVGSLVFYPLEYVANTFGYTLYTNMEQDTTFLYYIISFTYIVVVGPIVEELVYRGGILMSLRRFGDKFAITVSAILFGLMHGNILQAIFATIVGFVLGYICVKTNSLRYCIIIHMLNNFVSLLLSDWIYPQIPEQMIWMLDIVMNAGFLLLGLGILYYFRGKIHVETMGEIPVDRPYRRYFTRIPVILLILFFAFEIIFLSVSPLE